MQKNNKGITIVTLAMAIVVLIIIAGVSIYGATYLIDVANVQNITTNMLFIQAKAKTISEKSIFESDETLLQGEKITDVDYDAINNLKEQEIISDQEENYDSYYLWNREILDNNDLQDVELEEGDFYIVNYKTNEVIYTKGFKKTDGKTGYKLSELKSEVEE